MAISAFAAIKTAGGTAGCLDDIIHTNISDGDLAIVVDAINDKTYHYTYNSSSAATESDPDIIQPDSNSGNGRWILTKTQSFSSYMRDVVDADNLTEFLNGLSIEYNTIWVPAAAFESLDTNGAILSTNEYATNDVFLRFAEFSGSTEQYVAFNLPMPEAWDRSTIKAKFYWAPASGASAGDTVEWQIQGLAIGDDDAIDGSFTDTGEVISDTVLSGTNGDMHISGATPAVTINGTPALGDLVNFKVSRNVSGTDDMTENAYLFGVLIQIKLSNEVSGW